MATESTDVIREELERLKHAHDDLRREIRELRGADAGLSRRRGVLASAGTTAESLLKFIYRREGREKGSKPADKLMLDDLVGALKDVLPEHIQVPLRTVQAYRNLGAHDKGDIRSVDEQALLTVNTALNQAVVWFFESYLGGEFAALAKTRDPDEPGPGEALKPALLEWRELYWWVMRGGQLKVLDQKALEKRQREAGLSDAEVGGVRSGYKRDVQTFLQAVAEAVEDGVLEDYEVEGLEEMRVAACLSIREAQDLAAAGLRKVAAIPAGAPGWMTNPSREVPTPAPAAVVNPGAMARPPLRVDPLPFPPPVRAPNSPCPVRIEAGEFVMGASEGDEEAADDEKPARRVRITRPFEMWNVPVTQKQYSEVMGSNPANFQGRDDRPVEQVSWYGAVRYCNALSEKQGLAVAYDIKETDNADEPKVTFKGLDSGGWRLPTEAEWEYACRAGTTGARYAAVDEVAWYDDNSSATTHPVGLKRPNAWGLYDMLGNVWEWCWDGYAEKPDGSLDPIVPSRGDDRVSRGGSWCNSARGARASGRCYNSPDFRYGDLGFRPVRSLTK